MTVDIDWSDRPATGEIVVRIDREGADPVERTKAWFRGEPLRIAKPVFMPSTWATACIGNLCRFFPELPADGPPPFAVVLPSAIYRPQDFHMFIGGPLSAANVPFVVEYTPPDSPWGLFSRVDPTWQLIRCHCYQDLEFVEVVFAACESRELSFLTENPCDSDWDCTPLADAAYEQTRILCQVAASPVDLARLTLLPGWSVDGLVLTGPYATRDDQELELVRAKTGPLTFRRSRPNHALDGTLLGRAGFFWAIDRPRIANAALGLGRAMPEYQVLWIVDKLPGMERWAEIDKLEVIRHVRQRKPAVRRSVRAKRL